MKRSTDFWLRVPQSDPDEGKEGTRIHCQIKAVGKKQEATGHKTTSHIRGPYTANKQTVPWTGGKRDHAGSDMTGEAASEIH